MYLHLPVGGWPVLSGWAAGTARMPAIKRAGVRASGLAGWRTGERTGGRTDGRTDGRAGWRTAVRRIDERAVESGGRSSSMKTLMFTGNRRTATETLALPR